MKRLVRNSMGVFAVVLLAGGLPALPVSAVTPQYGWYEENGGKYWYENGVRQGLTGRGKEIYDPSSDAWYWLDANEQGRVAVNKDVYQESNGGKWVRYDAEGHMVKGESYANGGWYRFDEITGAMIKGWYTLVTPEGASYLYYYDPNTGIMQKGELTIGGDNCVFDQGTGIGYDQRWYEKNGAKYWYEGAKRQGTTGRGKEIYDPVSDAWYWLDAVNQGAMAVSKDVYQESNGGKWVRYDKDGHMVKGHNYSNGSWYYFDPVTGAMAKGWYNEVLADGTVNTYYFEPASGKRIHGTVIIDKEQCAFDKTTGIALDKKWLALNGAKYWYEGGKRQGTAGRGKEIYDPASQAWYWLDGTANGAMAVNKDVYQDANGGKWVRYDQNGQMVKGWNIKDNRSYYFDPVTGAMVKGTATIDGVEYTFNKNTGVLEKSQGNVPLNYVWDPVNYKYMKADGTLDHSVSITYDEKGRTIRETTYDANGQMTGYVAYGYDNSGNLLRENSFNSKAGTVYTYEYTYDTAGRETKVVYKDGQDASRSYTLTSEYANENLSKQITYNGGGTKTKVENYFYDPGTKLLIQKNVNNVSNNVETLAYAYAYRRNAVGNITEEKCTQFVGKQEILVYRDTFEDYDRNGNYKLHTEYDKNNNKSRYTTYSYYTYGGTSYERQVMTYRFDGRILSGYEYERNGAYPVKYTKYKADKVVETWTDYDKTPYPTGNAVSHITTDHIYEGSGTGKLKEIVETEYRLNAYEE